MIRPLRGVVFWAPRVLTILMVLFLAVLALDVFQEKRDAVWTFAAFFIHLIPAFVFAVVLALAWRWELLGVAVFAIIGVANIILARGRQPLAQAPITGALLLNSILYLLSWRLRPKDREGSSPENTLR